MAEVRADYLLGQIQALRSFVLVLATTHPEPALLRAHLEISSQVALAKLETLPVHDRAIAAFQETIAELFSALDRTPSSDRET